MNGVQPASSRSTTKHPETIKRKLVTITMIMVRPLLSILYVVHVVHGLALLGGPQSTPAVSRRQAFTTTAAAVAGLSFLTQVPTNAAHAATAAAATAAGGAGPTKDELERLRVGYQNIQYLLDHFDQETTICRENGGECKRDADAIRRALGLRSTTDPLFQIEKVFAKVKNINDDSIDLERLEAFFDATEEFNSATNMSNSMSFISQFGEYNPGGGQDQVLKYLIESKKQVEAAQKALKTICEVLNVPTN
jgi:hypothetical protein